MVQARACGVRVSRTAKAVLAKVAALPALAVAQQALAQSADPKPWQLNMGKGVTESSMHAYEAHMLALWICVAIGVIVFGAMGYAMFKFRKSKGAKPDVDFTHSTKLEVVWTVIPVVLLVVMAIPATHKLIAMYDTSEAEMTVKIRGYQWLWEYEYVGEGVTFTSRLDRKSDDIRQSGVVPTAADHEHYLLDVDNVLVLPTDTKIRFLITANDVIHAWWVPALGWKQDAIPGIINDNWTNIKTPGIYRGQCAELCGKDHGFMPIVVKAVPRAEYTQWLAQQKAEHGTGEADVQLATPVPQDTPAPEADAAAADEPASTAQAAPAAAPTAG